MLVYCVAVKNYNEAARNLSLSLSSTYTVSGTYRSTKFFGKMYSLDSVFQILTKDKKGFGF